MRPLNTLGPVADLGLTRALDYADDISNTVVDAIGGVPGGVPLFETIGLGGVQVIIVNPVQQAGTAGKRGSQFSGTVFPYLTLPSTDGVVINTVNFTPGARTFWHSHERGQIILVIAGRGLIQVRGGSVHVLRAGDTVWAPPGESHWHGAAEDSYMVHTAISLGTTNWAEAVTDAEYAGPDRKGSG